MKRALISILCMLALACDTAPFESTAVAASQATLVAPNPVPEYVIHADAWLSFETGTNGFSITTNFFGTNIVGSGLSRNWRESPDRVLNPTISTNFHPAPAKIVINGVTNDDSGGTRGLSIDCNTNTQYWFASDLSTAQATVSMAGWFMTTIPTDGSNFATYDFWWLYSADGSQWSVAQFQNGSLRSHCADTGSNNNGKGNNIAFSSGTWYWLVLYYNQGVSSVLEVYDSSKNLLGTSTVAMGTSRPCSHTGLGSGGHGQQNAKFIYIDNLCWKLTNNFTALRPK